MKLRLFIFGGLPGAGKSTLAKALAAHTGATYIRIDTIEQAIRSSENYTQPMWDEGYLVGFGLALDNLRLGRVVVADSVNPIAYTRDRWLQVATAAGAEAVEIEVICTDLAEHRQRVEGRATDVPGLKLPTWQEVIEREYEPYPRERVVIDTAGKPPEDSVADLLAKVKPKIR